jgi:hypothetical protein
MTVKLNMPPLVETAAQAQPRTFYEDAKGKVVYTMYRTNYLAFSKGRIELYSLKSVTFPLRPLPRGLTLTIGEVE